MRILFYNEIDLNRIPKLDKVIRFLENDDLRSADVKKVGTNLYRARLNKADRLLFALYKSNQKTYALILEHIKNHDYDKSRFLRRGVKINEDLIPPTEHVKSDSLESLPHLAQETSCFHLLQKPIAFDEAQQQIYSLPTPIILIGTAGSGKTLLLLEKMKHLHGDILYITQSPYLATHSQNLYFSHQFNEKNQSVSFLSFQDFLDSIVVQSGKRMEFSDFKEWFSRHLNATPIKDARSLHEEFQGVITGASIDNAYLSPPEYLALGIKESIFAGNQRYDVYDLFERYLDYLKTHNRYIHNIVSFDYLGLKKKSYDYVVVDEVQDFSPIQLHLTLSSLTNPNHFLLCGDANQVVYPNFFSWTRIKSLFFQAGSHSSSNLTQILNTNYRNSDSVIEVANKLLRIKNWRFGSIDKESHYEMKTSAFDKGSLAFLQGDQQTLTSINDKTHASKDFAVIVLYDELKQVADRYFKTPLIFSIQECKGLEYKNIILFNIISSESLSFEEICHGITDDILESPMRYARNKDKTDKSLEKYKFFINALFVAITRAQLNLYWVEEQADHPLLGLLRSDNSTHSASGIDIDHHASSAEEWQFEASKLDQQGKSEQAKQIRQEILHQLTPPWEVIAGKGIDKLFDAALVQKDKKAKLSLFEYTLVYEDHRSRNALIEIDFSPALYPKDGMERLLKKHFMMYQLNQLDAIKRQIKKYGIDFRNPFNQTPLMVGAWLGKRQVIQLANSLNADSFLANNKGFNAFQIALEQAYLHPSYAKEKLETVYSLLKPETLSIRLNNKLIKLEHNQDEFFLINLMIALFYRILPEKMVLTNGAFSADSLTQAIEYWPDYILPENFHHPDSINAVLSHNQLSQNYNDNPPLFIQLSADNYLINPNMMLKAEGEWLYIYDILLFDDLSIGYQEKTDGLDTNPIYKLLLTDKIAAYKQLLGINTY